MSVCDTSSEVMADRFRVMPSFRDRLQFSDTMIDPNAMDSQLRSLDNNSSFLDLPDGETPVSVKKRSNWGWWSLVAPFVL